MQPHETAYVDGPRAQIGVARVNEFGHELAHATGQGNAVTVGSRGDEIVIDLEAVS